MDELKSKAVTALGFDMPSAGDLVKREDYKTDAEFYMALSAMDDRLNNPSFRAAIRKGRAEHRTEDERAERIRQLNEFKQYKREAELGEFEKKEIDQQATQLAYHELAVGKIRASELGARIADHAEKLTDKRLNQKASSAQINALFRR